MTLDEAVATFKRELPGWYWSVCECHVSVHGHCGPDSWPGYRDSEDYGIEPIDVELFKPSNPFNPDHGTGPDPTPADLIMALVERAKAARKP